MENPKSRAPALQLARRAGIVLFWLFVCFASHCKNMQKLQNPPLPTWQPGEGDRGTPRAKRAHREGADVHPASGHSIPGFAAKTPDGFILFFCSGYNLKSQASSQFLPQMKLSFWVPLCAKPLFLRDGVPTLACAGTSWGAGENRVNIGL